MFFNQVLTLYGFLFLCTCNADIRDYCHDNHCEDPSKHVVCLYATGKLSTSCKNVHQSKLSQKDITGILKAHNELRRGLDGPSAPFFTWDYELASMAQMWADQCPSHRDGCRKNIDKLYNPVFQNVLKKEMKPGKYITWSDIIANWFNNNVYNSRILDEFHGNNFAVDHIGCGLVITTKYYIKFGRFGTAVERFPRYIVNLVCNYSFS